MLTLGPTMTWVFGLTGGIASGKSTVGRRFAARRVPVIDADQVAREVVAQGTEGLAAVVEAFGASVLAPSGELDRKALAAIVFADPTRRATLNAITHPRIAAATREAIARLSAAGEPLVCYEAALLVENGLADAFRPLVVVAASPDEQVRRTRTRDGASEDEARARIASQMPLADKVQKADLVIHNDGPLEALLDQADQALAAVAQRTGVPLDRYPLPGLICGARRRSGRATPADPKIPPPGPGCSSSGGSPARSACRGRPPASRTVATPPSAGRRR